MKKFCFFLPSLFLVSFLSADEGAVDVAAGRDQSMWQMVIMIVLALLFFYFIMWRPEQKRRKALKEQRDSLKKGDKVTAIGIIGTVSKIEETTVILKMYDGSKIEVLKTAVSDVHSGAVLEGSKEGK